MKRVPVQKAPTAALVELVRQRAAGGTSLGADPTQDLSTPEEWGTLKDWMEYSIDLLYAPGERWRDHVRSELELTAEQLAAFSRRTMEQGAISVGNVAATLGKRAGDAAAGLAEGFGVGFEKFWGFKPGEGLVGFAVLGLVVLGAAVFLLTTGGGQAILYGMGSGYHNVLSGWGASFPVLASSAPMLAETVPAALPDTVKALTVLV